MQQAIHWDYADDFSGRDAAYLIAGFDPSSNNAEDAYRVQPIIQKLKDAYYLACAEIRHDLNYGSDEASQWSGLHRHRYNKGELLSVKMERMIQNFMSSRYVVEGHLKELEGLDRFSATFDTKHQFPDTDALKDANDKLESAHAALAQHWEKTSPQDYAQFLEIKQKIDEAEQKHAAYEISFNNYFAIKQELDFELRKLRTVLNEKSRADDPSLFEAINHAHETWCEINARKIDWNDAKSHEEEVLYKKVQHLRSEATNEGFEWESKYIHEFDGQRFSRGELWRWLSDNKHSTAYSFAQKQLPEDKALSSKEKNNYLNLIGALADLYCKIAYPGEQHVQSKLLADLEKYKDFSGLSESHLKRTLPLARKAIESS